MQQNYVKVKLFNEEIEVIKGTTLLELSKKYENKYYHDILVGKIDGHYEELTKKIDNDCVVKFYDLTRSYSNRIYVNGLIFLTGYAARKVLGKKFFLRVLHSIDKGIYIETSDNISENDLNSIKEKMKELVNNPIRFEKVNVERVDAINYFSKLGYNTKANLLHYNANKYITLYKLGDMYEYLYSLMPYDTSVFKEFDFTYIDNNSFILRFPTRYHSNSIPEYNDHPQMFKVFEEYRTWKQLMHLDYVSDLNKKVSTGHIEDIIRIDETLQNSRLLNLAKEIYERKENIKIVLLSGPSSSGKTTTCRKLAMYLRSFGLNPKTLSMDDYFKENKDAVIKPNGEPDYECLQAIDLDLFDDQIWKLLSGEEVLTPTFNFILGQKEYKKKLKLESDDILMIEGIHALNPEILTNIKREKKYKIYLSPLIELNIDNLTRISTTDNRVLRRMVRDNKTRGKSAVVSLRTWHNVREGEESWVFPYQDEADYTFNTALSYEIGVLKTYAEPLLYSVPEKDPNYDDAKRLINMLGFFLPIPSESIPEDSIIREFIGNSCFHEEN